MILRYEELSKNPERLLAFTGHTRKEFEQLLPSFEVAWEQHRAREHNCMVSQIRVAVEHILAGVKRVRIVKDRFRNTKPRFADRVMLIACGLHNLRQSVRHPGPLCPTG